MKNTIRNIYCFIVHRTVFIRQFKFHFSFGLTSRPLRVTVCTGDNGVDVPRFGVVFLLFRQPEGLAPEYSTSVSGDD